MPKSLRAGSVWLLSAALACPPAGAEGLPEFPTEVSAAASMAGQEPPPEVGAAREAPSESVCVVPVSSEQPPASSACRGDLAASRATVAAAPGQEGLLSALDAVVEGAWPVSEAGCRVVLERARAAQVLRPMSAEDVAGAVCRETGLSCLELESTGSVASGCGASASPAVPIDSVPLMSAVERPFRQAATKKEGYSRAFRISEAFAWGGTAFDMGTTAKGMSLGASEAGIYRVVGERNTAGVLLMGAGVEVAFTFLSRAVYRGGHKKFATALNLIRGSVHVAAGTHNLGVIRQLQR